MIERTMRTPKEYTDNLKNGIVSDAMLSDVLFSYSKRAKNYRDRLRKYKGSSRWGMYTLRNFEQCEEKMNNYYAKKSDILRLCDNMPKCIHQLTYNHRRRIYDYNDEWSLLEEERDNYKRHKQSKVIWMNSYFDDYNGDYVEFCDIIEKNFQWFLYYEFNAHSFHRPIDESELSEYDGLEVVKLEELTTYGENINDLLPVPFCDKVWSFLSERER